MSVDSQKKLLDDLISRYYEKTDKLFSVLVANASRAAVDRVHEKIDQKQDEDIKELQEAINKLNSNQSNGSFFLDLAFSIIAGPVLGHLLEAGLKNIGTVIINNRKSLLQSAELLDSLAGAGKKWGALAKDGLSKEMSTKLAGSWKAVKTITLAGDISPTDYFSMFGPFANDTAQVIGQKSMEALTGQDSSVVKTSAPSPKPQYENPLKVKNLPIAEFSESVSDYIATQQGTNLANKYAATWMSGLIRDEDVLTGMMQRFGGYIDALPDFDNKIVRHQLTLILEAVIWIYYIGEPSKWASDKYTDSDMYAHTLEGYSDPQKSNYETHNVFTYYVNIPKSIYNYFLTRFEVPGTGQSFYDYYRKQKQTALNRQDGYGVDTKDDAAGTVWKNYLPQTYYQFTPDKPIDDPESIDYNAYDMAGYKMVEWFKSLEKELTSGEKSLAMFLSAKGIKPVLPRQY